jgi:TonB family protein
VYPEGASQGQRQGNVNLIGRIDEKGKVTDIRLAGATLEAFIDPAVAAVNAWEFKPATRAGKPIVIAANIALRFRLEGDKRGDIPSPMLGDLAIFPADAAGKATGPDGYPIHAASTGACRGSRAGRAPDKKPALNLPSRSLAVGKEGPSSTTSCGQARNESEDPLHGSRPPRLGRRRVAGSL